MKNLNNENRYRCRWCNFVIDEHLKILNPEEQEKYKDISLPQHHCKDCWNYIKWENKTYGFN